LNGSKKRIETGIPSKSKKSNPSKAVFKVNECSMVMNYCFSNAEGIGYF